VADVLKVSESARFLLTRNSVTLYEQIYHSATDQTYTRHAADRLVLSSNMSGFQEASLGDINSTNLGAHLMVASDRAITIAVNTTSQYISADTLMMVNTSVSHLYFKNTDANKTATVSFMVTD
jgi:hypothetical protein